jgi:Nod factor-specific ABC transporter NodJ protein
MFNGVKAVYYREFMVLRTRIVRTVVASMVSPALFMLAFGYGLGRWQTVGSVSYVDFLFVGLCAMSTLNASYSVATDINIARFYFKTFSEYLIAPIARWQIVLGEMLFGMTKGAINALIFFIYALIVDLNIHISLLFLLILIIHMAIFSLLGFIVALGVTSHKDQASIGTFIITPMTFLSGVFFPMSQAPVLLQWLVQLFPLSHSVVLMRSSLGAEPASTVHMLILLAFLLIFFLLALTLAKRMEG